MRRSQRKGDNVPHAINTLNTDIINMECYSTQNSDVPNTTKQPHLRYADLVVGINSNPVPEHGYGVINQPRC